MLHDRQVGGVDLLNNIYALHVGRGAKNHLVFINLRESAINELFTLKIEAQWHNWFFQAKIPREFWVLTITK